MSALPQRELTLQEHISAAADRANALALLVRRVLQDEMATNSGLRNAVVAARAETAIEAARELLRQAAVNLGVIGVMQEVRDV